MNRDIATKSLNPPKIEVFEESEVEHTLGTSFRESGKIEVRHTHQVSSETRDNGGWGHPWSRLKRAGSELNAQTHE